MTAKKIILCTGREACRSSVDGLSGGLTSYERSSTGTRVARAPAHNRRRTPRHRDRAGVRAPWLDVSLFGGRPACCERRTGSL